MKKVTSFLLVFVLAISLIGCSKNTPTSNPNPETDEQSTTTADSSTTPSDEFSSAKIDWKRFDGDSIKVMLSQHWVSDAFVERVDEFEELTNITVNYEQIPETDYRNKLLIEFNSGSNPPDVIMENYAFLGTDVPSGWAADLYPYINNPELTDSDFYDFNDFMEDAINYCEYDGKLPGIPITSDRSVLMYRKDLFEEKGISVPETFDELYEAAVALNDPANGISGFVSRMKRSNGAAHVWGNYLYSFGGKGIVVNDDGTKSAFLNTPEAIAAAEFYAKILRDAGPQGAVNYGWSEALSEFQAGKAAIFADNSSFMGQVEDPKLSKVVGKVGYAQMPGDGVHPVKIHINHWMLGICELGSNKEAGWYFVQWATSKPVADAIALENGNGARVSSWQTDDFKAKYDELYIKASLGEPGTGERYIVPQIDEMLESMDSIDVGLQRIYAGEDATAVMNEVQKQHEEFMK